jgi:hypothetical protein
MSGGSAKREMEMATSHGKAPSRESDAKWREESPPCVKSHRSGDKKKKMKKVVYYETDSSSPSTSSSDVASVTSKRKKFSKIPLRYPCISKHAPLLSVPLSKPPVFYGEDYCMWSDKMRHHLTSLHTSIWDIVEFGAQIPFVGDEGYNSNEVAQIRHFNSQATTHPAPRGCATNMVSPVILSLNALCLVIVTGITTRRGGKGKEEVLQ